MTESDTYLDASMGLDDATPVVTHDTLAQIVGLLAEAPKDRRYSIELTIEERVVDSSGTDDED